MWESIGGGERDYQSNRRVRLPTIGTSGSTYQPGDGIAEESPSKDDVRSLAPAGGGIIDELAGLAERGRKMPASMPSLPPPPAIVGDVDIAASSRLMHLESRVGGAERGNKALLEELVRWQSDLKAMARRQDELRREERRETLQLRANTAANNDDIGRLKQKLQTAEDQLANGRLNQHAVADQLKRLQQAVIDNHQAHTVHEDQLNLRFDRWQTDTKHSLEQMLRLQDESERRMAALAEEVRRLSAVQDSRTLEFQAALSELRTNVKQSFSEQQGIMANVSENHTKLTQLNSECSKLAPVMYEGLKQVEKSIADLQGKLFHQERDEQTRLAALVTKVNESEMSQRNAGSQLAHRLESQEKLVQEMSARLEAARASTAQQLSTMVDAQKKDVTKVADDLRELLERRLKDVEEALAKEKDGRLAITKECQADIEARYTLLQKELRERLVEYDAVTKSHRQVIDTTLKQLHESIHLNEQQIAKVQRAMEKVVHAEIETRKKDDERLRKATEEVTQKYEEAVIAVRRTVTTLKAQITDAREKMQTQWKRELSEHVQHADRSAVDTEARVSVMLERMSALETWSKNLAEQVGRDQDELLRQHRSLVDEWKESTGRELQQLTVLSEALPAEISDLKKKLSSLKTSLSSQLESERQNRLQEQSRYHQDLASKLPAAMFERLQNDVARQLTSLDSRLTNALGQLRDCENTAKLSQIDIGSKINSETNARMEVSVELNQRLAKLRGEVDYLLHQTQRRADDFLQHPIRIGPEVINVGVAATHPFATTGRTRQTPDIEVVRDHSPERHRSTPTRGAEDNVSSRPTTPFSSTSRGRPRVANARGTSPRSRIPRLASPSIPRATLRSATQRAASPRGATNRQASPQSRLATPSTPRATTPRAASPRVATSRQASPQSRIPRLATPSTPRATTPRAASPRGATNRQKSPQSRIPRLATPGTPRATTPRAASPRGATNRQASPQSRIPRLATPGTPRATTPRAASPRGATNRQASPQSRIPRLATPNTPRATTPRAASPRVATSRATTPRAVSPQEEVAPNSFQLIITTPPEDTSLADPVLLPSTPVGSKEEEKEEKEEEQEKKDENTDKETPPPEVSPRTTEPIQHRQVFVRPTSHGKTSKSRKIGSDLPYLNINQWSVYGAWTWMKIKRKWRQLQQQRRKRLGTPVLQRRPDDGGDADGSQSESGSHYREPTPVMVPLD